jgi:hypothetical protein
MFDIAVAALIFPLQIYGKRHSASTTLLLSVKIADRLS